MIVLGSSYVVVHLVPENVLEEKVSLEHRPSKRLVDLYLSNSNRSPPKSRPLGACFSKSLKTFGMSQIPTYVVKKEVVLSHQFLPVNLLLAVSTT